MKLPSNDCYFFNDHESSSEKGGEGNVEDSAEEQHGIAFEKARKASL